MMHQYTLPGFPLSRKKTPKPFKKPALSQVDRKKISEYLIEESANVMNFKKRERLFKEATEFCKCGHNFELWICDQDDQLFHVAHSCHSRICERCGHAYAKRLEPDMLNVLKPLLSKKVKGYFLSLLTLTVSKDRFKGGMPTREDIDRLYRESNDFFKLYYNLYQHYRAKSGKIVEDKRRYDYETIFGKVKKTRRKPKITDTPKGPKEDYRKYRGAGYISTIELGRDNNNLHVHALVYGPFIRQKNLSEKWREITGDSFIVDIKPIRDLKRAAWYVLKYIVKPPAGNNLRAIAQYAVMIKGTRRLRIGGIFFNRIHKEKLESVEFCCPYCGSHLHNDGNAITGNPDLARSEPLYKLLHEKKNRGTPPVPNGKQLTTDPIDRTKCRFIAENIIIGLTDCVPYFNDPRWPIIGKYLVELS